MSCCAGCIKPLCDLLEVKDAKVVIVALEGLENILRVGEQQKTGEFNEIATLIDEADGVNKIQSLQYHANEGTSAWLLAGLLAGVSYGRGG